MSPRGIIGWRITFLLLFAIAFSSYAQPVITTQPVGRSVVSGSNVTFSVVATGTPPLTYRWQLAGTNLSGATSASLTIPNVQMGNGGLYTVVVSNASGTVTSQGALLAVDEHLTFRIIELATNGVRVIEHGTVNGDDRGGLAVSGQIVLLNGDGPSNQGEAGRFSAADLTGGTALGVSYEGLVSDLQTERIYCLGNGTNLIGNGGGTVSSLIELDPETGARTANRITLSTNFSLGGASSGRSGVFCGYGRIVLWDSETARTYDVSLPSGKVTLLGITPGITHSPSESWAFWGIAEYHGNALYLVYVQDFQTIARRRAGLNTPPTVVRSFGNLSDMASIAFSTSRSRWYYHFELTSQFRSGGDESLGYAKALFTTDPGFPSILVQPLSQNAFPGDNVTLTVNATGSQPLLYQWSLNGTNIANATNSTLVLTNVQPTANGNYSVTVANGLGSATSANAVLFVVTAPQILVQPVSRSAPAGTNVLFSVIAQAAPPVSFQWRLNGTNILNATNTTYFIPVVSSTDVGNYSLIVSNRFGVTNSANASLSLIVDSGFSFRISSLDNDATVVEVADVVGSDRGGLALSTTNVFLIGNIGMGRFRASDLSGGERLNAFYDSLVSDLRSQRVFALSSNLNVLNYGGGIVTGLQEVNPETGLLTTNLIRLSAPVNATGTDVGLFAGYGQIVIFVSNRVHSIAIPSGIVADLGTMSSFTHRFSASWAYWGVAENFGGSVYLVYAQNATSIMRTRVPDGATTTVGNFINLSDMANLTVSVPRGRWYFHHQGPSEFGGTNEVIGFASATFDLTISPVVHHFTWAPLSAQQSPGTPFAVTVTARDSDDNVITNFSGPALLEGLLVGDAQPVTISLSALNNFVNGAWTGNITVPGANAGMVLRAYDLAGHSGVTTPFAVTAPDDLAVQVAPSSAVATLNSGFSYVIVVTNFGPSASTGVFLTNVLPANVNLSGTTSSQGSCAVVAGAVVCDLGAINGGAGASVKIELSPNTIDPLTNSVRIVRAQADAHPEDNAITVITPVVVPRITISDASVTEANVPILVTNLFAVTLSATSSLPITVQYSTTAATATNVGDYIARAGVLTLPPGVLSTNIAIPISGDLRYEGNEFFFVNLFNPTNAILVRTQAIGTIIDDEAVPVLTFLPAGISTNEGNSGTTTVLMNARLSGPAGVQAFVSLSTANGSALAGTDYFSTNAFLTFTNGASNILLSFRIIGDTVGESNEFFYVNLSSPQNIALGQTQAVINILNDDPVNLLDHFTWSSIGPTQTLNIPFTATVTAKDLLDRTITNFNGNVQLSAPKGASGGPDRVIGDLQSTAFGTPGPGFSYTLGFAFTPSRTIFMTHLRSYSGSKVSVWTDNGILLANRTSSGLSGAWVETPLTTPIQLNAGTTYRVAAYYASTDPYYFYTGTTPTAFKDGTIGNAYFLDSDGFPSLLLGQGLYLVDLGYVLTLQSFAMTPTNAVPFTNGIWSGPIRILSPGPKLVLSAADAGNLRFGTSNPFDVLAADDLDVRIVPSANPTPVNENLVYSVIVSNIGPTASTGVIVTNRLPAGAAFVSASLDRGLGVTRSGSILTGDIGTLSSGQAAVMQVTVRPSAAVTLTNSASVRRTEPEVHLANNSVTNVTVAVPLVLSVGNASVREGHSGTTNVVFAVALSAISTQTVSVAYSTANGSATVADNDYQAVSGTLTFVPGVLTQMVEVPVIGDVFNELNETFTLNLSNAVNAGLADSQAIATILNDDPLPTISLNDVTVTEGRSGLSVATFTLNLSAPSGRGVSLSASTLDSSAVAGSDYVGTNVAVIIPARQTNASVSVLIRGDSVDETDEVFFLNLSGAANATFAAVQARATIRNNDGAGGSNRFEFVLAPGPLAFAKPFDVTISARDPQGAIQPFNGLAALRGFSGTNPIVIAPTTTSNFANGIWSGSITVLSLVTNFHLVADDGAGRIGESDPLQLGWADVAISQSTVPAADVGTAFNYALIVSNRGPHTATSIVLTNRIPELDFVSSSGSGCRYENGIVVCTLASLTNGENATLTIVVKPRRGGAVTNSVSVGAFEGDLVPSNNLFSGVVLITGDDDADGMANEWEVLNGFSPNDPSDANLDADRDGHSNLQEYIAGTNPNNASAVLRLAGVLNNNQLQLSFRSVAGRVYRIEWTADPRFGAWTSLGDEITGDGDVLVATDPDGPGQPTRFYRVRVIR